MVGPSRLLTVENAINVSPNGLSTYAYNADGLRQTAAPGSVSPATTTFVSDGTDYLGEY